MSPSLTQVGTPTHAKSVVERPATGFGSETFIENFAALAEADGAIERLRGLVIELAIRGRLTKQHEGEQPAHALLARAASVLGQGRARRVLDVPIAREVSLPSGWVWCEPQDLGVVSPRNEAADSREVGFVPMAVVPTDYRRVVAAEVRKWSEIKKGYTHLADGDVAVAKITPCFQNGKSCVIRALRNGIGAGTTELLVLRPVSGVVEPNYLLLFYKSPDFIRGGIARMTGTAGQQRIPAEYFAAAPLALPPLVEQKRIVAKVDQLMSLCDDLEARQTKKRGTGTRLTTSALEALTTANGPEEFDLAWKRVVENFDALIDRAEKVRELRRTLRGLAYSGALVGQVGRWSIVTIQGLCSAIVDCPHTTPKWTGSGLICLRTTNFRVGGLDLSEVRFVSPETYRERVTRLEPRAGDIVYSREGGILGIACVIPAGPICLGQRMMLMRLDASRCVPEFIALMLNAPQTVATVEALTGGTASPHLNVGDVRRFTVPVPPVAEQRRIVAKVEQLMKVCDDLEARLLRAESRASKLVEAVVGELVA